MRSNHYVMTYRAADGSRVKHELQAESMAAAWDSAFDLAATCGDVRGFGVSKVAIAA